MYRILISLLVKQTLIQKWIVIYWPKLEQFCYFLSMSEVNILDNIFIHCVKILQDHIIGGSRLNLWYRIVIFCKIGCQLWNYMYWSSTSYIVALKCHGVLLFTKQCSNTLPLYQPGEPGCTVHIDLSDGMCNFNERLQSLSLKNKLKHWNCY